MPRGIVALVSHAFATTIGAFAFGKGEHLFDWGIFRVIDGNGSDLFGESQTVGMAIDHKDLTRAFEHGRVRCHEPDWATAVNHNGFARP